MKPRLLVAGLAMTAMTVFNFAAPDAALFREPSLARIIFWHLPCAFVCTWFLFHSAYHGFRYLQSRDMKWDNRLGGSVELGALFGGLTLVTGILFSYVQWGEWWHWDPRQTSFLMVMFLFALGLALRGGFAEEEKRAAVSSAYSVLSLLPNLFLIFVFPRLPQVAQASFHPSQTVAGGMLKGEYAIGVWGTLAALALVTIEIYSLRTRAADLAHQLDKQHGHDEALGGRAAATGVVRPVGVSEDR